MATKRNAISTTEHLRRAQAEIVEMRDGIDALRSYLQSPKFHEDTTVQTADVLLRLSEILRAGTAARYPDAGDLVPERVAMHEEWIQRNENARAHPCRICGGPMDERSERVHERCRLRAVKLLPTPPFSDVPECNCHGCRSR